MVVGMRGLGVCRWGQDGRADPWCSGKHHRHGARIQVLTDSRGLPVRVSPAERANALITHDKALRHVILSPTRTTAIARAALALLKMKYEHRRENLNVSQRIDPSTCTWDALAVSPDRGILARRVADPAGEFSGRPALRVGRRLAPRMPE